MKDITELWQTATLEVSCVLSHFTEYEECPMVVKVSVKSILATLIFNGILQVIINYLSVQCTSLLKFFNWCALIMFFNQNNFSLLQRHFFSSLMMFLVWGRGNLPLRWDHRNSKPQLSNQSSPALIFSHSKPFYSDMRDKKEKEASRKFRSILTLNSLFRESGVNFLLILWFLT